eukprot:scaffold742_cov165-Amphora_coffeaeformis.AAC.8
MDPIVTKCQPNSGGSAAVLGGVCQNWCRLARSKKVCARCTLLHSTIISRVRTNKKRDTSNGGN